MNYKELIAKIKKEFKNKKITEKTSPTKISNIIWNKISGIKHYIESLLNPEKYSRMVELNYFNDKEKEEMLEIYSKIMQWYWYFSKLYYSNEEEKIKDKLDKLFESYLEFKEYMIKISNKLIKCWQSGIKDEKDKNYIS